MTPRRAGWDFAQIRTSFLSDPEFQRLSRVCRNDRDFLAAVGLWTIATAQAWREDYEDVGEVLTSYPGFAKGPDHLRAADLIREGDRLTGFGKWTETVRRVREQDAARKRGLQPTPLESRGVPPSPADFPRGVGVGVVEAVPIPTSPATPETAGTVNEWDGYGPEWDAFGAVMTARGFRRPPTPRQRAILWPIVEARPADAARWASETPGDVKFSVVVGHVLEEWDAFRAGTTSAPERPDDHGTAAIEKQHEKHQRERENAERDAAKVSAGFAALRPQLAATPIAAPIAS